MPLTGEQPFEGEPNPVPRQFHQLEEVTVPTQVFLSVARGHAGSGPNQICDIDGFFRLTARPRM